MVSGDRVAVVTGATGGLGRAIAQCLAERGYQLVLQYRSDREPADELAGRLATTAGVRPTMIAAELTSERDVERLFSTAVLRGAVTVLVNNAGIYPAVPFFDATVDDWQQTLAVNLIAPYLCLKAAADVMPSGGSVVNVTSIAAARSDPEQAVYASSKAALVSLTRTAAQALAPRGIRVNAVSPGLVSRPGLPNDWPDGYERWLARAPLGRPVDAHQVATACAFLCESTDITGQELVIDAGISAARHY